MTKCIATKLRNIKVKLSSYLGNFKNKNKQLHSQYNKTKDY